MKRTILLLALLTSVSARAAGAGAFVGKMDTDALGDSTVYGAQLDFDFVAKIGQNAPAAPTQKRFFEALPPKKRRKT